MIGGDQQLPFSVSDFRCLNPAPSAPTCQPLEPLDSQFGKFGARILYVTKVLEQIECKFIIDKLKGGGHTETFNSTLQARGRSIFDAPELAEVLHERLNLSKFKISGIEIDSSGRPSRCDDNVSGSEVAPETICMHDAWARNKMNGRWWPTKLNPKLRFCSYQSGGFFRAHCDGQVFIADDEISFYTCMLYLDDDFEGGATRFLDPHLQNGKVCRGEVAAESIVAEVRPEAGSCLLFYQPGLLHEGEAIQSGQKHILRSDVIFKREPGTGEQQTEAQRQALSLLAQAQDAETKKEYEHAMRLYKKAFRLDPSLEGPV